MKVRIGISLGPAATPGGLAGTADLLESAGIDSLWLSEVVYGDLVEPLIGMTYALARTTRLKVGTGVAVLPGRHPVLVAKELASLAALAPGRVLPVFGLRPARRPEAAAFPVAGHRAAVFDESLELLRLLLAGGQVSYAGQFFTVESALVGPAPAKPLDIWLGGSAPAGLRRVGRFGDGWLGSFLTPAEAGAAREEIQAAAAAAGRQIEEDHFGISLAVSEGAILPELARAVESRRPGVDPASLAPASWADARRMIEEYVAVGLSKFVVRPATGRVPIEQFVGQFVAEMLPLQN
ncbi:MAG TPA: TIGR03854 family LLM class F420-dependent oxidoreductase [Streptosporangiaceae bacterium]